MSARSFLNVLVSDKQGRVDPGRDRVVVGLEKHGPLFPMRSLRTHEYSYIRYYAPGPYACTDSGPALEFLKQHADDPEYKRMAELCCGEHPAEELYDLAKDPNKLDNVAENPAYAAVRARLAADLEKYLRETGDPRVLGPGTDKFENAPRYNAKSASEAQIRRRPRRTGGETVWADWAPKE